MNEDRDISNFEELASRTRQQLIASKEKSMEWLHMAVDASAEQLEKAGDFTKLERSSHIPPCPKCHKTDFRKSY